MKTIVYIDGLNLYYRANLKARDKLKGTKCLWLDLKLLSSNWLQNESYKQCNITEIKYFTSLVREKPLVVYSQQSRKKQCSDLRDRLAQKRYLAALAAHIAELEIILGTHVEKTAYSYAKETGKKVEVFKIEEKETDVNLACSLLNDAYMDCYDCAAVISSDTDIAPALDLLKKHHPHKKVIILDPNLSGKYQIPKRLEDNCDHSARIRKSILENSQLPNVIKDKRNGKVIRKPFFW